MRTTCENDRFGPTRPISGAERKIRAPYLRSNERAGPGTTPDTYPFRTSENACSFNKILTSGFLRHGRAKRMIGYWGRNKSGPMRRAYGACGHSSRLTQLSLVGLHLCRARLRFAERPHYRSPTIYRQSRKFKTDISAYRVAGLKTDISAYRVHSQNPTRSRASEPRSYRVKISPVISWSVVAGFQAPLAGRRCATPYFRKDAIRAACRRNHLASLL